MLSKAWQYSKNSDSYDLIQVEKTLSPTPGPGKVRVSVRAVALNYRDVVAWKNLANRNVDGRVPASDGAGVIVAVGENVDAWRIGDRVAGCFFQTWYSGPFELNHHKNDLGGSLDGMLQTTIDLDQHGIVAIPNHLTYSQASTLPCAGLTAWYALHTRGNIQPGSSVLCIGTGGVSIFALQFAKAAGANVYLISSDDEKRRRAEEMGAVQTWNYKSNSDWPQQLWQATKEKGVDHIVEVGGPGTLENSLKVVAANGHIALIGVLTGFGAPNCSLFPLLARNIRLDGIYVGSRADFIEMNAALKAHNIIPVVDRVFDMKSAPQAMEYLSSAKHFGKVVVELGNDS